MRRIFFALFLLAFLGGLASSAIPVQVEVATSLDGKIPFFETPAQAPDAPQEFTLVWENTGSIGCSFQMQSNVYCMGSEGEEFLYSSWSEPVPIEPGSSGTLRSYWYPRASGNCSVMTLLHYCNTISDGPASNFSVSVSNKTRAELPFELEATGTPEYVEFTFDAASGGDSLVIIPLNYPLGWSFPSREFEIREGENVVRIPYYASIWKPCNVTFDLVSKDGSFYSSEVVSLERQEEPFPVYKAAAGFLSFVVLILLVYIVSLRRGRNLNV